MIDVGKQQIDQKSAERIDNVRTIRESEIEYEQKQKNIEKYRERAAKRLPLFEDGEAAPLPKINPKNPKGYYKKGKKYSAQIWMNGKTKCLGLFNTAKEARKAYLKAKAKCKKRKNKK